MHPHMRERARILSTENQFEWRVAYCTIAVALQRQYRSSKQSALMQFLGAFLSMTSAVQLLRRSVSWPTKETLFGPVVALLTHRHLIWQFVKREVLGRYRGSVMGLVWAVLNPLLMLSVYTFVFSEVFKSRWPGSKVDSTAEFAIMLFTGLLVYGLFSECINRAPGLILSNSNYVKKVIFPLEIMPWVAMGTAVFNAATGALVLICGIWLVKGAVPLTALLTPLVVAPLILTTIGLSLFLSATGVFYRDLGQGIGVVSTVLLFMSPVFYPASALPAAYQPWLALNPLTYVIEDARNVLIRGESLQWAWWIFQMVASYAVAVAGYWWFQKTRKGFADVL
jgi:lipopolysaccharide transport system permease protein